MFLFPCSHTYTVSVTELHVICLNIIVSFYFSCAFLLFLFLHKKAFILAFSTTLAVKIYTPTEELEINHNYLNIQTITLQVSDTFSKCLFMLSQHFWDPSLVYHATLIVLYCFICEIFNGCEGNSHSLYKIYDWCINNLRISLFVDAIPYFKSCCLLLIIRSTILFF